jgi:large repetitive protein
MRHLKLFSLLAVPWLALFAAGCGSGNSIGHTAQTITFDNSGSQTVGAPLTLSATANSGLTVSFTSATPSVCTVSGTMATFVAAGTCTIDASAAGNSTYATASQVAQSFTVNPAIGPTTTIYIAGFAISTASTPSNVVNVAEEWKLTSGSPTATATALSMPSGMTSAYANAIAISGSDVYVVGDASNSTNQTAVYWLNNGAATTCPAV